jgi:hypothetical protein
MPRPQPHKLRLLAYKRRIRRRSQRIRECPFADECLDEQWCHLSGRGAQLLCFAHLGRGVRIVFGMKERVGVTHAEGDIVGIVAQEVLEIEVRGAVITLRLGLLQTCRSASGGGRRVTPVLPPGYAEKIYSFPVSLARR